MSYLVNEILSSLDGAPAAKSPAPGNARQPPAAKVAKPAPRAEGVTNGAQALKRKASTPPEGGQVKIQRKEGSAVPGRSNGFASTRQAPATDAPKSRPTTPSAPMPYRGTAGTGGLNGKLSSTVAVKKSTVVTKPAAATAKPAAAKPVATKPSSGAAPVSNKPLSYADALKRAQEAQKAKAPAPLIKHEPTKILTKAERLALREEAKLKKPTAQLTALSRGRPTPGVVKDEAKEKRKPAEVAYKGTAQPARKTEIGYKGTAKPKSAGSTPRYTGTAAARVKPREPPARYTYVSSEEEDEEEDESDMEGGIWDVEEEESKALKAAKKEDAEALAEENRLKREKEQRKQKLLALAAKSKTKKFSY